MGGGTLRVKKMSLAALLTYAGALFIAAAIPGPGITAIVARALGSNFRETFFMGLGTVLGDMTYLTSVILGLAFVAQTFTEVFIAIKIAGVLYLGYIAWKLWTAGLLPQDIAARKSTNIGLSFLSGLLVTLGNPKTMLFYVATGADADRYRQYRPARLCAPAHHHLRGADRRARALYAACLAGPHDAEAAAGLAGAEPGCIRHPRRHGRLHRHAGGLK